VPKGLQNPVGHYADPGVGRVGIALSSMSEHDYLAQFTSEDLPMWMASLRSIWSRSVPITHEGNLAVAQWLP